MKLENCFNRVATWNAARYERKFNMNLATALMQEEMRETIDATAAGDLLEFLDSIGDVMFVALGTEWKQGRDFKDLDLEPKVVDLAGTIDHCLDAKPVLSFIVVFTMCQGLVYELCGCDKEQAYHIVLECLEAVCTSNETKQVKKTAIDVKANIDKGATFVPPTADLQAIVDKYALA